MADLSKEIINTHYYKKLKSNISKLFIYSLTMRRHYMSLLSIYFLTLPDSNANKIGIYCAAGAFATLIFEMPSGYLSDKIGHKNSLVISRVIMLISTISFTFGGSFAFFLFGAFLMSLSFALDSGTSNALLHDTLKEMNKKNNYCKTSGKISANSALASIFLIISLPFLTEINIKLPFIVSIFIDLIGFLVSLSLIEPKNERKLNMKNQISFYLALKKTEIKFFTTSLFIGIIGGFMIGTTGFRSPYLQSLGFPIYLLGIVSGISKIVWFFVGNNTSNIRWKIGTYKLMSIEMIIFPLSFIIISALNNPYIAALILAITNGYFWARQPVFNHYLLNNYVADKYKATLLSINNLIRAMFQVVIPLSIGFIMAQSYKMGYFILGICFFICLLLLYPFLKHQALSEIE